MGNVHPELYAWLCRNWAREPERAARLQAFLGMSSLLELRGYPVSAKYYLQLEGVPLTLRSRTRPDVVLAPWERTQIAQLRELSRAMAQEYPLGT